LFIYQNISGQLLPLEQIFQNRILVIADDRAFQETETGFAILVLTTK